jgi:iron complex transport system permease protein
VACDTLARTVFAPVEVPVGVITALLGGPFFLWLLLARRREVFF